MSVPFHTAQMTPHQKGLTLGTERRTRQDKTNPLPLRCIDQKSTDGWMDRQMRMRMRVEYNIL